MSMFIDVVHAFSTIEGILRSTYQPERRRWLAVRHGLA